MNGITNAEKAFKLVREGRITLFKQAKASAHFTWGELVTERTDDQIKQHFKLYHAVNLAKLADWLEMVRRFLGNKPITITSGWRDAETQRGLVKSGLGARFSRHLTGQAVDITVAGMTPQQVYNRLLPIWPQRGGLGNGANYGFTHLDYRGFAVKPFKY